jgi:hypothetical protein
MAACSNCAIHADTLLQIRDPEGRAGLAAPSGITRTSAGSWVVTSFENPGRVSLFSSTGRFVRTVGRTGDGPGEFRSATLATFGPGDSVWIFDSQLMRATVLDSSLRYARSFRVVASPPLDLVVFPDSRIVIGAEYRTGERAGYPLHIIEPSGSLSRSIGTDAPAYHRGSPSVSRRSFWPASSTSIWTADIVRYRIQQWSLAGAKLKEIVRNVDWFRPHTTFPYPADRASQPPPPGVISVHQDSTGLLWTLVRVPDPRWKNAVGPRQNVLGRTVTGVLDRDRYWDTLVEVLDPTTGNLVASLRVDVVLQRFVANRSAFHYYEDSVGEPTIVIWRFSLVEQPRRRSP